MTMNVKQHDEQQMTRKESAVHIHSKVSLKKNVRENFAATLRLIFS
jgi:hypothetical protein